MKKLMIAVWLCVPVAAAAYHYGPGQDRLRLDQVGELIQQAQAQAEKENWAEAEKHYAKALEIIPGEQVDSVRRLRLERAKAQMFVSKLPAAHGELEKLVGELEADPKAEGKVLDDARASLANSKYYMTWLMRLEGQPREKWEPVIEAARQNYRLLAEKADKVEDAAAAKKNREDLEASIKLASMDLDELQGLPLPSQ